MPSLGQAMRLSKTEIGATSAVSKTTVFQYLCVEGRRSTRGLKKDRKANLTANIVPQESASYDQVIRCIKAITCRRRDSSEGIILAAEVGSKLDSSTM